MAEPDVTIDLFGGPTLRVAGEDVALSPLQACLVAVVFGRLNPGAIQYRARTSAASGQRGISRRKLVRLLWGTDSPETRHRLSQLLYSFTKKKGGAGLYDSGPDAVAPGYPEEARDLRRFRDLLDTGDLLPAVDLLNRDYLSGITMIPGREFEEWWERARAQVRGAVRQAAASRWTRLAEAESWGQAGEAAVAMLRLDPEDEGALRNVLLAKGMAGRVQEALAEYAGFREKASAGGTGCPLSDPRTERLVERLESLALEVPTEDDRPARRPDPEPELCGRGDELGLLHRLTADQPDDPSPTTVVVRGEAGIGKTRLVREAIRGAKLRGFTALEARSSEFERDIPLNPLLEALDREETGEAIHELAEPWHSVILSLLPQFHREPGPLPAVPYVDPGNLPRRTYEALRRLFETLSSRSPILLFLDDFQWADDTSVAAVEFIRRRWKGGRLVIVFAQRPTGSAPPSRALEFTEDLVQLGEGVEIQLNELEEEAVHQLIDTVVAEDIEPALRERIALLGGRNPFFSIELAHEYMKGRLDLRPSPREPIPVPVSIRQLLERRLEELTPLGKRILETLAVFSGRCTVAQIAELCQASPPDCAEAVDCLQAARLIRWDEGGFTLRHQLVRHTVYDRLQEASRRLLHERIAEWLGDSEEVGAGELAFHFDRAGRADEALRFSLEAADLAEASGAVPEAVQLLATARRNTADPERAAEVVARLGHLHHMHRNFTEAAPLLDVAAERFRQQGRIGDALTAEAKKIDALSRLELLPLQDFLQKADDLKRESRERGEWKTLTQLLDVEIHTLDREGEIEGVRRVLREAEELCDKGGPAAQCSARATLAIDAFYRDPANGILHAREAVKIARKEQLTEGFLLAVNRLTLCQMIQGRFDLEDGEMLYEEVERVAETSGNLFQRFNLAGNRGIWHSDKQEFSRARCYFKRAEEIIRHSPAITAKIALNLNAGECEFLARNVEDATEYFRRANQMLPEARVGSHVRELIASGIGLCALHEGHLGKARTLEGEISVESREWVFDPFLLLLFKARMHERRRELLNAIEFIQEHTEAIRGRFVTSWLKLKQEEIRLWRKVDEREMCSTAEEGKAVADSLKLHQISSQFDALVR